MSLNPCFSGTYPLRSGGQTYIPLDQSLNPCFSGTYPLSFFIMIEEKYYIGVLILVLVEHTL